MEGSNQHSARVDDELKDDTETLAPGDPIEAQAEALQVDETSAGGAPFSESIGGRGAEETVAAGLKPSDVRARSELGRHLRMSLFPADRTTLVQFAVEKELPPDLVTALRGLPPGEYMNVDGVWEALGGRREERSGHTPGVDRDAAVEGRDTDERFRAEPIRDEIASGAAGTATGMPGAAAATQRFDFRFDLLHRLAAAPFLVAPASAEVVVDRTGSRPMLRVRFGPWRVETPIENVMSTTITGPYQPLKTVGPAHLSLADWGLTFATNDARGLCICFREPVRGGEPLGLVRHPSITVTVANIDGLREAIRPS
jgi:hypothetical protein